MLGLRSELPPAALLEADVDHDVSPTDDPANLRPVWCRVFALSLSDYWLAPTNSARFKDALEWIFHSDPTAPNSFDNVCLLLRLPPVRTRAMVAARCSQFRANPSLAERAVRDLFKGIGEGGCE